jgi:large subunit ribosomal protein L24
VSVQRIRKNDIVIAISGVNSGRTGKVLRVLPASGKAFVEGLNVVKKTVKKSQDRPQGGIIQKDAPIGLSKLMLYCPNDKKGVRTVRVSDGDALVRKCRICGHVFGG